MRLIKSWVDRVVWLLTLVFFIYMFLMIVGCSGTKYGGPPCIYGWLVVSEEEDQLNIN